MAARELIAPHGCLVLHVDSKTSHYAKVLCDEIFGPRAFASENSQFPARARRPLAIRQGSVRAPQVPTAIRAPGSVHSGNVGKRTAACTLRLGWSADSIEYGRRADTRRTVGGRLGNRNRRTRIARAHRVPDSETRTAPRATRRSLH
jgi:hypothetical protein